MSISIAEQHELKCPECGRTDTRLVWVAVDVEERPDLAELLRTPDAYLAPCAACRTLVVRDAPVLVVRMANAAPVVLGCPDMRLALDDPTTGSEELLEHVNEAMRQQRRAVPGPVLSVPFDVLLTAMSRDIDRDVADPERAVRAVARTSEAAADRYAIFLGHVLDSAADRRMGAALDEVAGIASEADLRRVLAAWPELTTEAAQARAEANVATELDPRARRLYEAQVEMLRASASGDIARGWAVYERAMTSFGQDVFEAETASLRDAFDAVVETDGEAATVIGEQLVVKAAELGALPLEAYAASQTARVYFGLAGGDRAAHLERCCELFERALEIHDRHPDVGDEHDRAQVLLNLGAALGGRLGGDPVVNQERAITLQVRALDLLSMKTDGHAWAMAHTNLGLGLLERPDAARDGSTDDAIDHFEQALRWRTFERDPLDWAYTQVNLALAFERRVADDRAADLRRSICHNTEAMRGFAAADHAAHGAQALSNRATAQTQLALLDDTPLDERAALLAAAQRDARAAIAALGEDAVGLDASRRWAQLGRVLAADGSYTPDLVEAHRLALIGLTPQTAPRECRHTAQRLAALATEANDWGVAAEAWEQAALAGAAAVDARATRAARLAEVHHNLNVFRWSAYALLRAGQPARAVEILELGRGRELAVWLARDVVDLAPVRKAAPRLAGRFLDLRQRIEHADRAGSTVGDISAASVFEELARTVAEIRRLPGQERFLRRPSVLDLTATALPGEVIAYPVTSPNGSAWLLLGADLEEAVEVVDLPGLTSTEVFAALAQPADEPGVVVGYLAEQAVTGSRLDAEIAAVARLLGPELVKPLADALTTSGATEVCIVPIGLLGLVPLHAITWQEDGVERCLLDSIDVSYAPSAYVQRVCQARAAERPGFGRLVAVGNPLPQSIPLPGAEYEARMVAELVSAPSTDILLGTEATKEAVVAALPGASHLHLACHGCAAGNAAALDSALSLDHDRPIAAAEILDIDLGAVRLVVASACETGVIPGYEEADESLSLSTVFLGAGAAGVIASLWSVNDYATSLLMTRFYAELVHQPQSPARALRAAQLWLRGLSGEEEERWLTRHPALAEQRKRLPERVSDRIATTRAHENAYRFAAPTMWAGFVFSGA